MARVSIKSLADSVPSPTFPDVPGLVPSGRIDAFGLFAGPKRTLQLWIYELSPGATLRWDAPPGAHAVFVRSGEVLADGVRLAADSAVIVEHGGQSEIIAGEQGASLADFFSLQSSVDSSERSGGNVHHVGREGLYRKSMRGGRSSIVMFADSTCSTCETWLHRSCLPPNIDVPPHWHTEDEIILVVRGALMVGTRALPPGSALAVQADTIYGFATGEDGLDFINFRTTDPQIILTRNGKAITDPISERELITGTLNDKVVGQIEEILNAHV